MIFHFDDIGRYLGNDVAVLGVDKRYSEFPKWLNPFLVKQKKRMIQQVQHSTVSAESSICFSSSILTGLIKDSIL